MLLAAQKFSIFMFFATKPQDIQDEKLRGEMWSEVAIKLSRGEASGECLGMTTLGGREVGGVSGATLYLQTAVLAIEPTRIGSVCDGAKESRWF
jgi:hypothetical protein